MPRVIWVPLFVLVAATSCDKPPPKKTSTGLDAYCTSGPCRRHDEAVAKLRELTPTGSGCTLGDTGTCGEFRFVRYSDGYWGFTEWFDKAGAMVAAESWSDIAPRTRYGDVPGCELKATRRFCGAAEDCKKLRKNVVDAAAKLAACKTNDDCVVHRIPVCDFHELDCHAAHVNKSGDAASLDEAVSEYSKTCSLTKCKCEMPTKSVCKNGACAGE